MTNSDLKNFDDLFQSSEPQASSSNQSLQLSVLQPFSKHPFKLHNTEKMQELANSIYEHGIITPIIVRPIDNNKFEIVSGHNRAEAAKLAGLDIIPCDIRELDDDAATIIMVDANLQRETILPSEKAWAYRYKLEAIKSQGKRNDLTCVQVAHKSTKQKSREKIAEVSGDSADTVRRYIRLTQLIPQLLEKVDERKLAFIPAVELSYLKKQEQKWLYSNLAREEYFGVPLALARKMKGISQNGQLTEQKIDDMIVKKVQTPSKQIKVARKVLDKYFDRDITPKERDDVIDKALEEWFKLHPRKSNIPYVKQNDIER